jgi:hypothetical protein
MMTALRHRPALRVVLVLVLALAIAGALYGWSIERLKHSSTGAGRAVPVRLSGPLPPPLSGDIEDPTPLRQVLPLVHLDPMPFGEAVEFLRELSGQNIFVNWAKLSDLSPPVEPTTLVNVEMRLKDATLGQVIAKLLEALPAAAAGGYGPVGMAPPGFGVRDGIITISTDFDRKADVVGRWYYVDDLLDEPLHTGLPLTPGTEPADAAGLTRLERLDELVRLVTETVDPDSWIDAGGSVGSIRTFGGRLIVHQSPENHQKIEAIFRALRKGP